MLKLKQVENLIKLKEIINDNIDDDVKKLTGIKICDSMIDHITRKRWFDKMIALAKFRNVIMLLATFVGVAFCVSLSWDIITFLAIFSKHFIKRIITSLLKIITNHNFVGVMGILMAIITVYCKECDFKYLNVFDKHRPLFGCIIHYLATHYWYEYQTIITSGNYSIMYSYFICFFAAAAMRHQNWVIGCLTIHLIYVEFGFVVITGWWGSYTGFGEYDNAIKCLVISLILVGTFIMLEIHKTEYPYIKVFETGVYFWGTFIGCLAMLILSDYEFNIFYYDHRMWFMLQIPMFAICMSAMYFGYMLNKSSLKGIGGTFLVLWLLDIERLVLSMHENYTTTGILFLILVNLLGIYYYIKNHPKYFIL